MILLKVTIANIDGPFVWLFDSDDKRVCVRRALDDLIANHGFFKDNLILDRDKFPSIPEWVEPENVFGILLMPGEEEDLDYLLDNENTYWIYVEEYEPGTCITDRG